MALALSNTLLWMASKKKSWTKDQNSAARLKIKIANLWSPWISMEWTGQFDLWKRFWNFSLAMPKFEIDRVKSKNPDTFLPDLHGPPGDFKFEHSKNWYSQLPSPSFLTLNFPSYKLCVIAFNLKTLISLKILGQETLENGNEIFTFLASESLTLIGSFLKNWWRVFFSSWEFIFFKLGISLRKWLKNELTV